MRTVMLVTRMIIRNVLRILALARMALDTMATRPSRLLVGSTCRPTRKVAIPVETLETLAPTLLAGIPAHRSPSPNRTLASPRASSRVGPTRPVPVRITGYTALRDPWLRDTGKLPSSPPVEWAPGTR